MSKRRIVVRHNRVVMVQSGIIKVDVLSNPQWGFRYRLNIEGQLAIIKSDVRELVPFFENQDFAGKIVRIFTMEEAPTITSLRQILPKHSVEFPVPGRKSASRLGANR